ncbi:MAG: class I SAM-dependent RNA methyltransferase [Methyloceanibacter sp.]
MELEVEIERLGAKGDGVADGPEGPIFVPFTLPGERVRIAVEPGNDRAGLIEVLEASPDRIESICLHFGSCGGCALQHLESHAYLGWKRAQVVAALKSRGLDAEVDPVRSVPLGSRRRAALVLGRGKAGLALGYRRARSHDLIDVAVCPVLSPRIVASLPKLKEALAPLLGGKREAKVGVTDTGSGLDIVVEGIRPTPASLGASAGKAVSLGVARLTADVESIAPSGPPEVDLSGARVRLPPGAFLQASGAAEAVLTGLVREGVSGAKRLADLFAGLGTFTFALARDAAVDAFEGDEAALHALADAARKTPKLKPVRTFGRDLFRAPLGAKELQAYDAVVLDPPRAGASAQAQELAKSSVPKLVAVSCNPGTLARDLRFLVDGGYRIARIVPVDQFLFSPHIEVVAHLER